MTIGVKTPTRYRGDIDGLRAVAILMVIIYHAFPRFVQGGFIGVDIFFVISGYLISDIIRREISKNKFSFPLFYARRARRLFPTLLIVLTTTLVLGWFLLWPSEYKLLGKSVAAGAGFVANILFYKQIGYFDILSSEKPLLHLWSLGVEEQFYFVWPTILILAHKLRASWIPLALGVISFIGCWKITPHYPNAAFYLPITRIWEFTLGYLACLASAHISTGRWFAYRCRVGRGSVTVSDIASLVGLVLLAYGYMTIRHDYHFPGVVALLPTVGITMILIAGKEAWVNRNILAQPWLIYIGLISYPLYLWHWPIFSIESIIDNGYKSRSIIFALIFLSFILADFTWRFIENPLRYSKIKSMPWLLLSGMLIVGISGATIFLKEGYPGRFNPINGLVQKEQVIIDYMKDWHVIPCPSNATEYDLNTDVCKELAATGPTTRRILLLGDSHANSFAEAMTAVRNHGEMVFNARILAKSGCMAFPWIEKSGIRDTCHDFFNAAYDYAETPGNADTIILIGRWASKYDGKGFGVDTSEQYFKDIRSNANAHESQSDLFIRVLKDFLDRFAKDDHKRVIFVQQVPELGFNTKSCIQRPLSLTGVKDCTISRDLVEKRQSGYRAAVNRLLSNYQGVIIFDPMNVLCDAQRCYAKDNDEFLYLDSHHLTVAGARKLGRALEPYLK